MSKSRNLKLFEIFAKKPLFSKEIIEYIPKPLQRFILPDKPLPLGRWGIPKIDDDKYNYDKIHDKANMANYDHCDPCGREFSPKNFENKDIK